MLKNILGAVIGAKFAGKSPKADSPAGAVTGALMASAIPFVISRLSAPVMIAILVGGYVLQRGLPRTAIQPEKRAQLPLTSSDSAT